MLAQKIQSHPLFRMFQQLLRYGLVGGVSTLIHIGVAISFIRFIENSIIWSNVIGFLVAYCFSYTAQSLFVFREKLAPSKAIKFFLVQAAALGVAMLVSVSVIAAHPYIKVVLTALLLPLVAFLIHKLWTFKK